MTESTEHALRIPVDHGQFYVEDETLEDPLGWDIDATFARVARDHFGITPAGFVVGTVRHWGDTDIVVDVRAEAPTPPFDTWDHVVECGLAVPSGQITISAPETTGTPMVPRIRLAPGQYRAMVFYGALDSVTDELDPEGEDHYRVVLWPGEPREPVVLKRGFWCCRAGRHEHAPARGPGRHAPRVKAKRPGGV